MTAYLLYVPDGEHWTDDDGESEIGYAVVGIFDTESAAKRARAAVNRRRTLRVDVEADRIAANPYYGGRMTRAEALKIARYRFPAAFIRSAPSNPDVDAIETPAYQVMYDRPNLDDLKTTHPCPACDAPVEYDPDRDTLTWCDVCDWTGFSLSDLLKDRIEGSALFNRRTERVAR